MFEEEMREWYRTKREGRWIPESREDRPRLWVQSS